MIDQVSLFSPTLGLCVIRKTQSMRWLDGAALSTILGFSGWILSRPLGLDAEIAGLFTCAMA